MKSLILTTVTAALGLILVACEEPPAIEIAGSQEAPAATATLRTQAAPRLTVAVEENYELLGMLYDLQEKVLKLEIEIATHHDSYLENQFEDFLTLDPWSLTAEQVYFLKHFCDNGDFLLLKRAEALLLEREILRRRDADIDAVVSRSTAGVRSPVSERLDRAIRFYEQRVADLDKIAGLFRDASQNPITYPDYTSPAQLESDRQDVYAKQAEIAAELEKMATYLDELRDSYLGLGAPQ